MIGVDWLAEELDFTILSISTKQSRNQALLRRVCLILTSAHKLGEGGQEALYANAAHVDELPSQDSLPVSGRDRCRKNHLRERHSGR